LSQIYKSLAAGPVPPTVPTSFVTDINSPAVPAANILNVPGGSVTTNNNNGIQTDGSSGSNTLTVELTNRITGSVTTTDASLVTLASFALGAVPAVYTLSIEIACFNVTSVDGDGYFIQGSVRTTGAAAVLCGMPDKFISEEVIDTADANLIVSGNNAVIQVNGIVGITHDWRTVATYVQVI
jgi:hypothetical protein